MARWVQISVGCFIRAFELMNLEHGAWPLDLVLPGEFAEEASEVDGIWPRYCVHVDSLVDVLVWKSSGTTPEVCMASGSPTGNPALQCWSMNLDESEVSQAVCLNFSPSKPSIQNGMKSLT